MLRRALVTKDAKLTILQDHFVHPGPQPNGLQAADEGLWVIDQTDNHVYLLDWDDGSVLSKVLTETEHSSGITIGFDNIWVASTFTLKLVQCALDGSTIAKHETPGVGVVAFGDTINQRVTGAHGMEWVDDENMWVAVPPAERVFLMDPGTMTVKRSIPSPGARPHGLFIHNGQMWLADTGDCKIHRMDPETGEVLDEIDVPDPEVHGMTLRGDRIWFCCAVTRRVCSLELPT